MPSTCDSIIPDVLYSGKLLQMVGVIVYNSVMKVTDIKANKKDSRRVSVWLDGEFAFSCYAETLEDERVYIGNELRSADVDRIRQSDSAEYAWRTALRTLERGMKTEKQIRDKLQEREVEEELIRKTVQRLREYGLIDDMEYARLYAEQLYGKYGRWGVVSRLRERGIPQEIVDQVTDSDGDPEVLLRQTTKLYNKHRGDEKYKRDQKIMRSLAAKGFTFSDIRNAIRICEQNDGC